MSTIDQITYRARQGSAGIIDQAATSIRDQAASDRWLRLLEPWLRAGSPLGPAYLDFGSEAAFIRWHGEAGTRFDWQYAYVLVGQSDELTGTYALEFDDPDPRVPDESGRPLIAGPKERPGHDAIEARARSAEAIELLTPLLAHALQGERRVTMPWTEPGLPAVVMWGLISILRMAGDNRAVSFLTYASAHTREWDIPGLLVSFRADVPAPLPPDQGFAALAADLVHRFADDPDGLSQTLTEYVVPETPDHNARINRLLSLPPRIQPGTARVPPVTCPICLHEIEDWDALDYWRWDAGEGVYVELAVPPDLNSLQVTRYLRGAFVRCPAPPGDSRIGPHYLPADYGRFGPPVVLGFVGLTKSGKSHLLAAMLGAIEGRELENYGISCRPLDHALHRQFIDASVSPLLRRGMVLHGTRDGIVEFADAFLMRPRRGPERVVALFDVAGGDLAQLDETKRFLWIADGLFFVIDPDRIAAQRAEDQTFSNVLDVVRTSARRGTVSAAIIVNKADMMRFEMPVYRWLRSEGGSGGLDPVEFLRESADVYAFLDSRNALAMAAAYEVCEKATLHVASATGGADNGNRGDGGVYPRGVTPRRVLRPLVAMLAMTGVLTGPEAEKVGV
jgi:hypothetical protein